MEKSATASNDPARAFVRKIGEEIYDSDDDDELERRSVFHLTTNGHEFGK